MKRKIKGLHNNNNNSINKKLYTLKGNRYIGCRLQPRFVNAAKITSIAAFLQMWL